MLNVILPLNSLKNVVSLYKEIIELIVFIWEHIIKGYDSYSKFLVNIFFYISMSWLYSNGNEVFQSYFR